MPPCQAGSFPYAVRPGDTAWAIAQRYNTTIQAIAAANPGLNLNSLNIGQMICIPSAHGYAPSAAGISRAEATLSNHLRLLWEQHVYWTRLVILSIAFSLPDADPVTSRLLRNPKDFEQALRPFYGDTIAAQFSNLFTNHLVIASQLVKAAKAGDSNAAAAAEKNWYSNADEIAAFLGSMNPYWPVREWQRLLHDHLAMTKNEAVEILTRNYAGSIATFDNIERQALEMADTMTRGIVQQFPRYF